MSKVLIIDGDSTARRIALSCSHLAHGCMSKPFRSELVARERPSIPMVAA